MFPVFTLTPLAHNWPSQLQPSYAPIGCRFLRKCWCVKQGGGYNIQGAHQLLGSGSGWCLRSLFTNWPATVKLCSHTRGALDSMSIPTTMVDGATPHAPIQLTLSALLSEQLPGFPKYATLPSYATVLNPDVMSGAPWASYQHEFTVRLTGAKG